MSFKLTDSVTRKLPVISYNLRKRTTKQKPAKSKPITTFTPGSSNLQNTVTPSPYYPSSSPTNTSQNIQLSIPISTSPSVNSPNPPTTAFPQSYLEPAVALTSSPQNLRTANSTVDNLLALKDQYENQFQRHPSVEPYVPTTSTCNKPIISLGQPTCSQQFQVLPMQNKVFQTTKLAFTSNVSQLNRAQTFPNAHYASR